MKEAFDLIKARLIECQERYEAKALSNLSAYENLLEYGITKGKEGGVLEALSIVSEVEAEYINKSTEHIKKLRDCSTNGDKIRAMDDEELMEFLEPILVCDKRCPAGNGSCYDRCRARIREWLKSPIE